MTAWVTVPCLLKLRAEFDEIAPGRDRGADGTIGDAAHSPGSDHTPDEDSPILDDLDADSLNEVHALDIDADLRTPGLSMEAAVQHVVALARAGDRRLRYVIFNRRIWRAATGWGKEYYAGDDPHTNHAHFSASYATAQERSTEPWHLEDIMALTPDDKTWLATLVRTTVREELDKHSTEDGDTTPRRYSRDGLITTIEQDTKKIREILEAPQVPTDPPA